MRYMYLGNVIGTIAYYIGVILCVNANNFRLYNMHTNNEMHVSHVKFIDCSFFHRLNA